MPLVLDTDIFIDAFRGESKATAFIRDLVHRKETVYFNAITETELIAGQECTDPEKRERVLHTLSLFNKVLVDNRLAQLAGDIRREYSIPTPDAIIAATSMLAECALVTRNVKDFRKVKTLKLHPY